MNPATPTAIAIAAHRANSGANVDGVAVLRQAPLEQRGHPHLVIHHQHAPGPTLGGADETAMRTRPVLIRVTSTVANLVDMTPESTGCRLRIPAGRR
jgi:hypothetical protein